MTVSTRLSDGIVIACVHFGAAAGSVAMVLPGVEFGWMALVVGAVTGRHVVANAVAAYVLCAAGGLVEELSSLTLTPELLRSTRTVGSVPFASY